MNDNWLGKVSKEIREKKDVQVFLYYDVCVPWSFLPSMRKDITTYKKWKQNKTDEVNMLNNCSYSIIGIDIYDTLLGIFVEDSLSRSLFEKGLDA